MCSRFIAPVLTLLMIGSTSPMWAVRQNQGPPPPPQYQNQYPNNGNPNQYPNNGNPNQYPNNGNPNQYPNNGNPNPGQGYGQNGYGQGGWDAPPQGYTDVQRQGFHEGMQAARHDVQTQQQPDPRRHMEFRHPSVPPEARDQYREAFRQGYFMTMRHMHEGGNPQ